MFSWLHRNFISHLSVQDSFFFFVTEKKRFEALITVECSELGQGQQNLIGTSLTVIIDFHI